MNIPDIQTKVKFYAQYWGVKCFQNLINEKYGYGLYYVPFIEEQIMEEQILCLKPLSYIADEEALCIHKILGNINSCDYIEDEAYRIDAISEGRTLVDNFHNGDVWKLNYEAIDYLRSEGYALPYLNFSVKDLVGFGWVKLI